MNANNQIETFFQFLTVQGCGALFTERHIPKVCAYLSISWAWQQFLWHTISSALGSLDSDTWALPRPKWVLHCCKNGQGVIKYSTFFFLHDNFPFVILDDSARMMQEGKKTSFLPRCMVYNYTTKPTTTVLDSPNLIDLACGKRCTMYGSYLKCWEEGVHFILGPPLRLLLCVRVLCLKSGVLLRLLGPYLRRLALSMGNLYEIQRSQILPSSSILKSPCLILLISQNQVTLCRSLTTETHCEAIPTYTGLSVDDKDIIILSHESTADEIFKAQSYVTPVQNPCTP